jgi:hypothetical protein
MMLGYIWMVLLIITFILAIGVCELHAIRKEISAIRKALEAGRGWK